ncbi:glycosyltransferase family 4 protein [Cytobacillus oceanisediminis]|uniref:glycosyltransferase family 4 protein n=1 Tax=Cytobacillus oceanisediminis TaxID=665099 RepID=UPI001C216B0F|nr:glycosyltransferase family 4 protein [Cytobacillus oceanisediminis]MBU8769287.1 glycosyltransferase family 4 protein [Cytobacillus oceanisediminis]
MKILFVFYVPSGGVETLNRQRASALKSYNIESHALYYQKIRETINPFEGNVFIGKDPKFIKDILDKGNYDAIVIVSDYLILPLIRNLNYKGKIIFEIQGLGSQERARKYLMDGANSINIHANALLNPKTPRIDQLFNEIFPNKSKFSFNNCFDTSKFSYIKMAKHPSPIIAWIGRIVDNKNWKEFLYIGQELIRKVNPQIQLYMFEDPTLSDIKERNEFKQMVINLGLKGNLSILQNVMNDKMAEYFSKIGDSGGFYCLTSKSEGSPYSVLEALSCKCPVLSTDADGLRSSIIHNQTGKYYSLGNVTEAVIQAKELMTNKTLREQIRLNGFQHVQKHFSPELYAENFIKMLNELGINK